MDENEVSQVAVAPVPVAAVTDPAIIAEPETAPVAEPILSYVEQARFQRAAAISRLESCIADLPPVSSVDREYASTRSDLIYALNHLKAGRA